MLDLYLCLTMYLELLSMVVDLLVLFCYKFFKKIGAMCKLCMVSHLWFSPAGD
ncbi:hypothetical protein CDL12_14049 [Handroanthus impetiginosus]|uniref:Uncharacterized protein n=1 Tax=Handroanthus impetiginosus TaxID=429701 RepID=A0A2G9H740_9LAMI|nr:hypothetical protein CDL12_14049 [Handroanthus impetiginosus]